MRPLRNLSPGAAAALALLCLTTLAPAPARATQAAPSLTQAASLLPLDPEVLARLARVERSLVLFPRMQLTLEHGAAFVDPVVDRNHLLALQSRSSHFDRRLTPGLALFAAMSILGARAPAPLRVALVGNPHLGPALLTDGGFGVAARFRF